MKKNVFKRLHQASDNLHPPNNLGSNPNNLPPIQPPMNIEHSHQNDRPKKEKEKNIKDNNNNNNDNNNNKKKKKKRKCYSRMKWTMRPIARAMRTTTMRQMMRNLSRNRRRFFSEKRISGTGGPGGSECI